MKATAFLAGLVLALNTFLRGKRAVEERGCAVNIES